MEKILLLLEALLPHALSLYSQLRENHKNILTKSVEEILAESNSQWARVKERAEAELERVQQGGMVKPSEPRDA